MIANSVIELIGNTPLLKIKTDENSADIYAKMERNNSSGSVKDRAVLGMYEHAKNKGLINDETIFIEATSGNTGVSLAMIGAAFNHRVILAMPESMSQERRDLFKAYGAELVLTPKETGMRGADDKVQELLKEYNNAIQLAQFENGGNPNKHYETTAVEILNELPNVDAFVAGIGTAGTISGVSKYLKENLEQVLTVGIEPEESPVITKGEKGLHGIQGIGAGYVPDNYAAEYVDEVRRISVSDARYATKELVKSDGVLAGISGGANIKIAKDVAKELGAGKVVVTVLPDDGMKYISTGVFE